MQYDCEQLLKVATIEAARGPNSGEFERNSALSCEQDVHDRVGYQSSAENYGRNGEL